MYKLDERDLKILAVLQREGRITKTELAARVHLSPAACWERLKRLEQDGVIEGYGARLNSSMFGARMEIFMLAEIASHRREDFARFEQAVDKIGEIADCWAVGGGIDYFLRFSCSDVDTYQRLIDEMLQSDIGLQRYYTYVVTKAIKNAPLAALDALSSLPSEQV